MKQNHTIKEIEEKDLMEVSNIWKQVFHNQIEPDKAKETYKKAITNGNIHLLGYYIENKVVGTICFYILELLSGKEGMVWDLAVLEEYRGQGIATKLLEEVEKIAKQCEEIKRIWLFSGFHREGAHRLYQKMGYDENRDKGFVKTIK